MGYAPFSELISAELLNGVNLGFQEHQNSYTALYELVQSRSLLPFFCVRVYCEWSLKTNIQKKS